MRIYVDFDDCLCETARQLGEVGCILSKPAVNQEWMRCAAWIPEKAAITLTRPV